MTISIQNQLKQIPIVLDAAQQFLSAHTSNAELINVLKVILDEALSNIIKYAYPKGVTENIEIKMSIVNDSITVTITDNGRPFNPISDFVYNTHSQEKNLEEGGVGIHLMKNLVNEIQYQRLSSSNILTLTKSL